MNWLNRIVEKRLGKAAKDGSLSGLGGEGHPLPRKPHIEDAALEAGYRAMASAGVVPDEIKFHKAIAEHKAHMATLTNEDERKTAMAKLADLEMKLNIAREARRALHRS